MRYPEKQMQMSMWKSHVAVYYKQAKAHHEWANVSVKIYSNIMDGGKGGLFPRVLLGASKNKVFG